MHCNRHRLRHITPSITLLALAGASLLAGTPTVASAAPSSKAPVPQTLTGTAGDDFLEGGNGLDTVDGLDGNDVIDGGNGSDTLLGGTGDDMIYGGAGKDLIEPGEGMDTVDGGPDSATVRAYLIVQRLRVSSDTSEPTPTRFQPRVLVNQSHTHRKVRSNVKEIFVFTSNSPWTRNRSI